MAYTPFGWVLTVHFGFVDLEAPTLAGFLIFTLLSPSASGLLVCGGSAFSTHSTCHVGLGVGVVTDEFAVGAFGCRVAGIIEVTIRLRSVL